MQANLGLTGLRLWLVALLVAVASAAHAERQPLDRVIAIVDDGVILQSELDARVNTIRSRLQAQGTGLPPRQVLEDLTNLAERSLDLAHDLLALLQHVRLRRRQLPLHLHLLLLC